ncbi:MAG: aspartate-semialdehyde dehydrogenase [Candidatus Heimdallarchaeota archaeon]|nr:aspartate-semialdehyde dehydrogenase [Candidatus Heimdallarchaeota archaeon]
MKRVVVLGASGLIGQQFARMIALHPKLELAGLYASARSAEKTLRNLWNLPFYDYPFDEDITLKNMDSIDMDFDIAFSGLPADIGRQVEGRLRTEGKAVFSNSSAYRMDDDVPILIPEINAEHLELAKMQQDQYGGFIITNANCSVTGASLYLDAINRKFPIQTAIISTYQAMSGAGIRGVSGVQIMDNIIPYIAKEEGKMEEEGKKILGKIADNRVIPSDIDIIANCARVPVIDGHLESITTVVDGIYEQEEVINHLKALTSPLSEIAAPKPHLRYIDGIAPQPRIHRFLGEGILEGMSTLVGRTRVHQLHISSFVLVHNTIRGGAGGSVLNAELAMNTLKI